MMPEENLPASMNRVPRQTKSICRRNKKSAGLHEISCASLGRNSGSTAASAYSPVCNHGYYGRTWIIRILRSKINGVTEQSP